MASDQPITGEQSIPGEATARPVSDARPADPVAPVSDEKPDSEPAEPAQVGAQDDDPSQWGWLETSPAKLAAGLGFGVVFGFLLQKGGVAKFDILIGILLLEDFTVVQVMLTAIIVGMVGVYVLRRLGVVELHLSEARLGATVLGGLIFGVGFGLLAYCPGTTAAAVGQGNLDALVGVVGLMTGSYLFALSTRYRPKQPKPSRQRGKSTLPELLHVPDGLFVAVAAPVLVGVLVLLEWYTSS